MPAIARPNRSAPAAASTADILRFTAALHCDIDDAIIAATGTIRPGIEVIMTDALPRIPKVTFYNPFLASENGNKCLLAVEGAMRTSITRVRDLGGKQ